MPKTNKDRHHYIPEAYLKNFLIDNKLCVNVYEKGKDSFYATQPKNIAVERHYYAFNSKDGKFDTNSLEEMFSCVEFLWPDLIDKINKKKPLSTEDMDNLFNFMSLMRVRTPNFRMQYESFRVETAKTVGLALSSLPFSDAKNLARRAGIDADFLREEHWGTINQLFKEGQIAVKFNPQIGLEGIQHFVNIYENLRTMNWTIYYHDLEQDFITSDNPLVWHDIACTKNFLPYSGGLANKNVEVIFPLTKKSVLIGNRVFKNKLAMEK